MDYSRLRRRKTITTRLTPPGVHRVETGTPISRMGIIQGPHNGIRHSWCFPLTTIVTLSVALARQAREMLMAKDLWGRSLISHGILSGNPKVFEVAIKATRADVLEEEVRRS